LYLFHFDTILQSCCLSADTCSFNHVIGPDYGWNIFFPTNATNSILIWFVIPVKLPPFWRSGSNSGDWLSGFLLFRLIFHLGESNFQTRNWFSECTQNLFDFIPFDVFVLSPPVKTWSFWCKYVSPGWMIWKYIFYCKRNISDVKGERGSGVKKPIMSRFVENFPLNHLILTSYQNSKDFSEILRSTQKFGGFFTFSPQNVRVYCFSGCGCQNGLIFCIQSPNIIPQ